VKLLEFFFWVREVARRGKLLQGGRETERKQRKKRGISTKVSYLSLLILCNLFASVYC